MIGTAIKKYAQEKGLKITKDVAYGYIDGYLVTLIDGWDTKTASFSCDLTNEAIEMLDYIFSEKTFEKKYKLVDYEIDKDGLSIVFYDTIGTMDRVAAGVEYVIDILKHNSIQGDGICTCCGEPLKPDEQTRFVLKNNVVYKVHVPCADMLARYGAFAEEHRKFDKKSVVKGVVGAFLGSLIGALPMIIVCYFNKMHPILGILIGICAKYGYELFKGKVGATKIISVFSFSFIGSVLGMLLSVPAIYLSRFEDLNMNMAEALRFFVYRMMNVPGYAVSFIIDFVIVALVAFAGAYIFLKSSNEDDKRRIYKAKIIE